MSFHSVEEQTAATAVVSLKRSLELAESCPETITDLSDRERASKILKRRVTNSPSLSDKDGSSSVRSARNSSSSGTSANGDELAACLDRLCLPPPFYYYRDHSRDIDDDPKTPLTPKSRAPNFPAKMHAILSHPDLQDIVAWLPHGRSWRIFDAKEFELRVLPMYFDHRKFSSFIRQANGWGFRRITTGCDRNTYYHELFLRGMPFLCKRMNRPGITKKVAGDPDREPNFYKISKIFPIPEIPLHNNAFLAPVAAAKSPAIMGASSRSGVVTPPKTKSLSPLRRTVAQPAVDLQQVVRQIAAQQVAQQAEVQKQQAAQQVAKAVEAAAKHAAEAVAKHAAQQAAAKQAIQQAAVNQIFQQAVAQLAAQQAAAKQAVQQAAVEQAVQVQPADVQHVAQKATVAKQATEQAAAIQQAAHEAIAAFAQQQQQQQQQAATQRQAAAAAALSLILQPAALVPMMLQAEGAASGTGAGASLVAALANAKAPNDGARANTAALSSAGAQALNRVLSLQPALASAPASINLPMGLGL